MASGKKLKVTLIRGLRGKSEGQRATVRGLGLKWRSHTVEVDDTPQTRGMIDKIGFMLKVAASNGAGDN